MANRTDILAQNVHGTDPQNLVEHLLRQRIQNSRYWKEHCFGLDAETLIEKAVKIDHIGSTFGGIRKPTPFICLVLKLLQIQPPLEAVIEYVKQDEHKYLRALGAFYTRLVGDPVQVYKVLEPLYNDYRKLAVRSPSGWELSHMDELVDMLLREEFAWELTLPMLPKRRLLEASGKLAPRASLLAGLAAKDASREDAVGDAAVARARADSPAERAGGHFVASPGRDEDRASALALADRLLAKQRAAVAAAASAGDAPARAADAGRRRERGGSSSDSLSVEEWNKRRAELGMAPLRSGRS